MEFISVDFTKKQFVENVYETIKLIGSSCNKAHIWSRVRNEVLSSQETVTVFNVESSKPAEIWQS